MKDISAKRKIRIENKKKKMAALVNITKLNEYDRANKKSQMAKIENTVAEDRIEPEPSPKRIKVSHNTENTVISQESPPLIGDFGPSGKPKLSGKELLELKKMLREKTSKIRQQPNFRLRDMGENATMKVDLDNRMPLFLSDIQHLIMYSQVGPHSPYSPARWCALEKFNKLVNFNLLIVENIGLYHFSAHESMFPMLGNFEHKLEIVSPRAYMSEQVDIVKDLSMVPLTGTQMKKFVDKFGTLETAVSQCDEIFDTMKNIFPIESSEEDCETKNSGLPPNDKFSRTQLLLSGWQMVEENYPLPIKGLMERKYQGYVLTKDKYKDVTPFSPLFAVDCEMCKTSTGDLELTRVSVVDEKFQTCYDTLVKPDNKIVDYLTQYSGINSKMMRNVTKKLADVQKDLRSLLPRDAIIVGQSLSNDLHALKMMHPYVIDTSVIYNITGDRNRKTKLQTLTRQFLDERIQESKKGHCSTEDSLACIKLVQLKLKKNVFFGDAVMGSISHPDLATQQYATSMLKQCTKADHTCSIVGVDEIADKYKFYITKGSETTEGKQIKCFSGKSNEEVVTKMCENMKQFNLNIGHIRILDSQLEEDKAKTFKQIDKWAKDVFDSSGKPSLVVVLLSGHHECGNGLCFIQLKREFIK